MKIIEPQVELWQQTDPITHVAKCARVCYGNKEGKSTDQQLYDNLLKARHNSMFRHESVYAIIPKKKIPKGIYDAVWLTYHSEYINGLQDEKSFFISTNKNFLIDAEKDLIKRYMVDMIKEFQVTPEHFANTEVGHSMMRYTFHITTQISTSRELNRVSPNSIAERSTRYVDESEGAIVRPHWMSKDIANAWNENKELDCMSMASRKYLMSIQDQFILYSHLLKDGIKRQDARGVLPLDTATEVVYTYSVREWKHIINLRSSKAAHPNAQIIANMIKEQLNQLGYDL